MLEGLRVMEVGGDIAAQAAGDLFRRLGADVTRLTLPRPPTSSNEHTHLRARIHEIFDRGKKHVEVDNLWSEKALVALNNCDVVVAELNAIDARDLDDYLHLVRENNPGSWVTISPYGVYGPRRGRAGSELTNASAGGFTYYLRSTDGRPMKPAGFTSSITAGHVGVLAGLHGLMLRDNDEEKAHLDLSIQDTVVATSAFLECTAELFDCTRFTGSSRQGPPSGLVPCAAGLMWLMVVEDHHWKGFVRALDNPPWTAGIETVKEREAAAPMLEEGTRQWASERSNMEAVALLQAHGVPATAVNSCADLAREGCPDVRPGFFVDGEAGERLPGRPFAVVSPDEARPVSSAASAEPRPYRVLDVGNVLAGPLACSWLGAMGIDVLRVEDSTRVDVYRRRGPFPGGIPDTEHSAYFASANYSKRSYGIALDAEDGKQRLRDLIASADMVITNVSSHRASKLGLTPEVFDTYCDTGLISSEGISQLAPNASYRSYGLNCHASGGEVYLTRDAHGEPRNPTLPWGDPLTSIWIAIVAIAQLRRPPAQREHINVSMTEVVAFEFPEYFSLLTRDGLEVVSHENRTDDAAPHGIYRCAGEDRWIAIACETDSQWNAMLGVLDMPGSLTDPRFQTTAGRLAAHDELDAVLDEICSTHDRDDLGEQLQGAAVPASPVYSAADLVRDGHLGERELFQRVEHPVWGSGSITALPWRIADCGRIDIARTPLFGEHTIEDPDKWWLLPERKSADALH